MIKRRKLPKFVIGFAVGALLFVRALIQGDCPDSYKEPFRRTANIQCQRIVDGDVDYMKWLATKDVALSNRGCISALRITNCEKFTSEHGYFEKIVSEEEIAFPLAFGIKVHKDAVQVEQLLRTIYRPQNVYCIHVDLKADTTVREPLKTLASCLDNVYVLQEYNVIYSSIYQPMADIACMKTAIGTSINWKYFLILAGQEFILKTNLEIVRILKILNGTNDIESYPIPKPLLPRVANSHPIIGDKISKQSNISKSPFFRNITLLKGSGYGMMSRPFVRFILESDISKELFYWSKDVYAPEELLWATLNSLPDAPGGYSVHVKHADRTFISRAMIWKWDKAKCDGRYLRSVCVFSYKDLPWLVRSPAVIANKFMVTEDRLVLECLEAWITRKMELGSVQNLNLSYYRSLPHVRNNL